MLVGTNTMWVCGVEVVVGQKMVLEPLEPVTSSFKCPNMGARNWAQTFWKNKHSYNELPPPVLILLSKQNWSNSVYICFLYYYFLGWFIWSFYIPINQALVISCINYIQYIQLNLISDFLSRLPQHRHFVEGKICPTPDLVTLLTVLLLQMCCSS